jgi:hypothetical protein
MPRVLRRDFDSSIPVPRIRCKHIPLYRPKQWGPFIASQSHFDSGKQRVFVRIFDGVNKLLSFRAREYRETSLLHTGHSKNAHKPTGRELCTLRTSTGASQISLNIYGADIRSGGETDCSSGIIGTVKAHHCDLGIRN